MKRSTPKPYVGFIGGLFTEASPLSHPENTSKVEQNFKLNPDGSRERRLGLGLDAMIADDLSECCVVESYRWTDAGNANDRVMVAVQTGIEVHLYQEDNECQSTYTKELVINLSDYKVCDKDICNTPVDFASGNGYLFIAHGAIQPIYIKYTDEDDCYSDTQGWSVVPVNLYERDFDGVSDGISANENPSDLTPEHRYNLLNQGWTDELIQSYFSETETYPSNNESWYLGYYTDSSDGKEKWSAEEVQKSTYGTANTTRGHLIKNVFDSCDVFETQSELTYDVNLLDCSAANVVFSAPHGYEDGDTLTLVGSTIRHLYYPGAGNTDISVEEFSDVDGTYTVGTDIFIQDTYTLNFFYDGVTDSPNYDNMDSECTLQAQPEIVNFDNEIPSIDCCVTCGRPEVTGVYAGRVWYGGIDSSTIGNRIYFSQVLRTDSEIGRMYQKYDPTSRDFNELLDTDGGYIDIPEMGWVRGMKVLKDSLLIFADNGIWSISGGNYEYFAATSYSVSKLTEVGVVSKKSIEEIEDTWVYAANRGIYIISSENRVQNITEESIHTRYRKIPQANKKQIDIVYNPFDKTLHVLHGLNGEDCWRYCTELIINHRIKAWYEYKFKHSFLTHALHTGNDSSDVYDFMYLAEIGDSTNNSYFMDNCDYEDWSGTDLVEDAPAYMKTGAELLGELSVDKEIHDMYVFMKAEPEAGCIFRGRWDWACGDCSSDYTTEQQVFNGPATCDGGYANAVARSDIKVRGHGRAFEIEFSSEPKKPVTLYGWNVNYAARARS